MIELVRSSAEHHFLTTLDTLKAHPEGWICLYFSLSKMLAHEEIVADIRHIGDKLAAARKKSDDFVAELQSLCGAEMNGSICQFADLDVLAMIHVDGQSDKAKVGEIFARMSKKLPKSYSEMELLTHQYNGYHKIADAKFLTARRHGAYMAMADKHKVSSIESRRKRHEDPVVIMVEDDRFTAHYASNILSKDFDLIVCRNGEEAIEEYIEKAPHIVFMDIHLPGLSGHEALQAIHAIDHEAYIVMLSVDAVRDNIVRATKMGASKFVKKPFTRERLVNTVKNSPHVRTLMRGKRSFSSSDSMLP